MKKTTVFFVSIALVAIIVGGIGSAVYLKKLEKSTTATKQEQYTIKDQNNLDEVHLTLAGNSDFYIYSDESDEVLMKTQSSAATTLTSSLEAKEDNHGLTIKATGTEKNSASSHIEIGANLFFNRDSSISLSLPAGIKRLVIDGDATGFVHLSTISVDELTTSIDQADILLNTVKTTKLALTTTTGNQSVTFDTKSEEASFTTNSGNISTDDFSALNWSITSTDGAISLTKPKGIYTVDSKNGPVTVMYPKGEAFLKTANSDISFTINDLPKKLKAESQNGDIDMYTEEILYDATIQAKTKLGTSTIFDKNRTVYKQGKRTALFDLTSNSGDISVEGPFEYEDSSDD